MTQPAVLGLGGTVDYELEWASDRLDRLVAELDIASGDLQQPSQISSERDLVVSLLCHLRDGSGGEHFVDSPELIEAFASRFDYRVTLGGTPVRAAIAMSAVGVPSTVHLVSIDDSVRRLLPRDVDYLCSATEDSLNPHVIVQYPSGATIRLRDGEITSATGNRIIYPSDEPNRQLVISSDLGSSLRTARVFLISGLNSIQERDVLDARLEQLLEVMDALPAEAVVVYEDAAFHVPGFGAIARAALAPRLDVYSMNEDELMGYSGRSVDLLDARDVAESVHDQQAILNVPILALHTKHYALAHGNNSLPVRDALALGVAFAGARYAFGDGMSRKEVERLAASGAPNEEGLRVLRELKAMAGFVGTPALDLREVAAPTTIGLGDTFIGGVVTSLLRENSPERR